MPEATYKRPEPLPVDAGAAAEVEANYRPVLGGGGRNCCCAAEEPKDVVPRLLLRLGGVRNCWCGAGRPKKDDDVLRLGGVRNAEKPEVPARPPTGSW